MLTTAHDSSPDNAIGLVAQCELNRREFSHRPGNPATVGVEGWPSDGDTVCYD